MSIKYFVEVTNYRYAEDQDTVFIGPFPSREKAKEHAEVVNERLGYPKLNEDGQGISVDVWPPETIEAVAPEDFNTEAFLNGNARLNVQKDVQVD